MRAYANLVPDPASGGDEDHKCDRYIPREIN